MYPLQEWQLEELLEWKARSTFATVVDYIVCGIYWRVKTEKMTKKEGS